MAVFLRLRIFDKIIQLSEFADVTYPGKLHTEMHILVALGSGVSFKDHRHMKTIAL